MASCCLPRPAQARFTVLRPRGRGVVEAGIYAKLFTRTATDGALHRAAHRSPLLVAGESYFGLGDNFSQQHDLPPFHRHPFHFTHSRFVRPIPLSLICSSRFSQASLAKMRLISAALVFAAGALAASSAT